MLQTPTCFKNNPKISPSLSFDVLVNLVLVQNKVSGTLSFYGSPMNHLEVGIWVGQLVGVSVSTQMSKQAIFV